MGNEKKEKEYAVGEVFRHADGKVYQCVEDEHCEGCAFEPGDDNCCSLYCSSCAREDGRSVKFILVTEPSDGMLYRAENGRMYRLTKGNHWDKQCACDDDKSRSCAALDRSVFGDLLPTGWYWALVEEDAPVPVEPPKHHIELAVVKVEGDTVKFRIAEQTHRRNDFSQQALSYKFNASNGIALSSFEQPCWDVAFDTLFCLGYRTENDDLELVCTVTEFAQISAAVTEYNATDGKGHGFSWPKKGDKYFCIAPGGWVDRITFGMDGFDRKMQAFGNFFRTKEEAKAALERVKQALKK